MKKALRVRFSGIKDVILPEGVTQEEVDARINVITEELKSELYEIDNYLIKVNSIEQVTVNVEDKES
jgi:hypothetical protein